MYDIKKIVSKNLKRIRTELGYSQEKLAELAGIDRKTISYIETETNSIGADTIEKICNKLTISPAEFFIQDFPESKQDKISKIVTIISSVNDEQFEFLYKMINALK